MSGYHIPVMLNETIAALNLEEGKVIVDCTYGGGGHSRAILESCPEVRLISFDQDADAVKNAFTLQEQYSENFEIVHDNFVNLRTRLSLLRIKKIDGILLDLGVSSYQIDTASKGFSYLQDGELDMRMDQRAKVSASDIVNSYSAEELTRIFKEYGEEKESRRIANQICKVREAEPIKTTKQLATLIDKATHSPKKIKARSRIFQALRIEVNSELEYLKSVLLQAVNILNPGGRIVVLTYNSLEDRITKNYMNYEALDCICPKNFPTCQCSKVKRLKVLKSIIPGEEDAENVRSRSARLRIAERTANQEKR